ncbi:MAG: DUF4276 family protein [Spirochaetales bacterium]|nr:DUF4276 family protein [Spirochaetales bacterium]
MKEIFVYVEGPSDKLGLEAILYNHIQLASQKNNYIYFIALNGKDALLNKGPIKAINILKNKKNSHVFIVPDLYPQNKPFPHASYEELKNEVEKRFLYEIKRKNSDAGLIHRFHVHCFKYELEVLLLASPEILLKRLGKEKIRQTWKIPVENQNFNKPPKKVIEFLFSENKKRYKDTADIPWVLERSQLKLLMERCPQNFTPFIEDLLAIISA